MAKVITKTQMNEIKEAMRLGCINTANDLLNKYVGIRARAYTAYNYNADAIRENLKPLLDAVVDAPAADVVEAIHAHWIMHDDDFGLTCECSHCHIETMGDSEYCLHCGARMDGGI